MINHKLYKLYFAVAAVVRTKPKTVKHNTQKKEKEHNTQHIKVKRKAKSIDSMLSIVQKNVNLRKSGSKTLHFDSCASSGVDDFPQSDQQLNQVTSLVRHPHTVQMITTDHTGIIIVSKKILAVVRL